jgi:hypothetical protein
LLASESYYIGKGNEKDFERSFHWSEVAVLLDPEKYGERHKGLPQIMRLSREIAQISEKILAGRIANPFKNPVPGTVFRDCPECPEMIVVPGVDGGIPFAMSHAKISLTDIAACIPEAKCIYYWPMGVERDVLPPLEPDAPATIDGIHIDDYVHWLFTKTGHQYRLPSLPEWTWAANSGESTNPDHVGTCQGWNEAALGISARLRNVNKEPDKHAYPAPRTQLTANTYGLCDMTGPLGELAAACDQPYCAGSPIDEHEFVISVLAKPLDSNAVEFGRRHLNHLVRIFNFQSDPMDAGIQLVRYFPESLHKDITESRHKNWAD